MSNRGCGHGAEAVQEDLHVLPGGVEHLEHGRVGEERCQRRQVHARRLCIDDRDLLRAPELHDAQLGIVGALPHELGIDGHERFRPQPGAQRIEASRVGDELGRGERAIQHDRASPHLA